jgi:hypothetical protein
LAFESRLPTNNTRLLLVSIKPRKWTPYFSDDGVRLRLPSGWGRNASRISNKQKCQAVESMQSLHCAQHASQTNRFARIRIMGGNRQEVANCDETNGSRERPVQRQGATKI